MIRKTTHILLSLMILVTTTGLSVSFHVCQGKLENASLFNLSNIACTHDQDHHKDRSCCENELPPGCENEFPNDDKCCTSVSKFLDQTTEFLPVSTNKVKIPDMKLIAGLLSLDPGNHLNLNRTFQHFRWYLNQNFNSFVLDIPVLIQSFLI